MVDFCKDEYDISSCQPMDLSAGHVPFWGSTESQVQQSSTTLSGNLSLKIGNQSSSSHNVKQMSFLFQDQDSSSTQSTCESYHEVGSIAESNFSGPNIVSLGPECYQTLKQEVHELNSISSTGNQECVNPSNLNFGQSYACVPFPYTDPYYGGLLAQTMIQHPQMIGVGPTRVPLLPLDLPQNEPIYVNAKQYHAILRRRQYRAKLEAQNKLSKGRKPYLHESRHLHALKRARGTGGRFINTKSLQESKVADMAKPEPYHSKEFESRFLATSSSDNTSASNSDNIYQNQEFRFSLCPSSIGSFYAENQRYLSVNQ